MLTRSIQTLSLCVQAITHIDLINQGYFFLSQQGISQAAGYIYKKLVNDGILNQALSIVPVGVQLFSCMGCGWAIFFIAIVWIKVLVLMHSITTNFIVSL